MFSSDTMENVMILILNWISGSFKDILFLGFVSFLIVFIIFGIRKIILSFLFNRKVNHKNRLRYRRNSSYISLIVIVILLFPVLMPSVQNFLAVIGIFGAGVLLVMKEAIINVAGWFYIIVRRPLEEGNRISIAGYFGDVIEIRLQEFTMIEVKKKINGEQSTGRILHVPNYLVFSNVLSNASKEFSFNWHEMIIPITLKSDWKKAEKIIKEIAVHKLQGISGDDARIRRSENEFAIRYNRLEPGVYIEFNKGVIILTLRFLVEPKNLRSVTDVLWHEILSRLSKEKNIFLSDDPDVWGGRD